MIGALWLEETMGKLPIEVGGIYTNAGEVFAREVLLIVAGSVEYRDFVLQDGSPLSPCSRCSLSHFQRWSVRPVTPEEASRLRRDESDRSLKEYIRNLIPVALAAASDEALRAEIRRRGWRLARGE